MEVTPIAWTAIDPYAIHEVTPYAAHDGQSDIDELAEVAGRNCYQSWTRPNPNTATNAGYLSNILGMGHESVLEHGSVTFHVADASRSFLTEITRHRHLSFSVVSQRYVDASELVPVVPPAVEGLEMQDYAVALAMIEEHAWRSQELYEHLEALLRGNGDNRKEAREGARAVLPNCLDSPMVITGNLRAWRDVLRKRHHVAADRELQEFAGHVLDHLEQLAPHSVQDFPIEPLGSY